jgi:hypothetical protein
MTPFDPRLPIIARAAKVKTCHVFHCAMAMRDMKANFHIDAFAEFAGLDRRHVDAIISALKANNAMPTPAKRETASIGSRLSADFTIPESWIAWACKERGWQPQDAAQEGKTFVDYWIGVSGAKGVKLDWEATWRNSVRRSHRANGNYQTVEKRASALEIAQMQLRTAEMLGQTYEADEARKRIAMLSNVVPFKAAG